MGKRLYVGNLSYSVTDADLREAFTSGGYEVVDVKVMTDRETAMAIAGARCGFADPARVENADLTVPLEMDPNQISAGFGSIWVSEGLAGRVVRLDPGSGASQEYVEDCQVCCRPWRVFVTYREDGTPEVALEPEQE